MARILTAVFSLFLFVSGPALAEDGTDEAVHDAPLLEPIVRICLSPASGDRPAEETALDLQDYCPPGQISFLDYEISIEDLESRAEPIIGIPPPHSYDQE